MLKILITLALLSLVFAVAPMGVAAGELDGTRWKMHPEGWRGIVLFWQSDTLMFDAGKFESTACVPYGYVRGPYDSMKKGDKVMWSATQMNDKGEKMVWQGTLLSGDQLEGTFTWTKAGGKAKTIWWKARKQA